MGAHALLRRVRPAPGSSGRCWSCVSSCWNAAWWRPCCVRASGWRRQRFSLGLPSDIGPCVHCATEREDERAALLGVTEGQIPSYHCGKFSAALARRRCSNPPARQRINSFDWTCLGLFSWRSLHRADSGSQHICPTSMWLRTSAQLSKTKCANVAASGTETNWRIQWRN